MPDLEKVLKALSLCVETDEDCVCPEGCPYETQCWNGGLYSALMNDALELLEGQRARVMTLEEARAALKSEPVIWIEEKDGDTQAAIRKKSYYETQTDEVIDFSDLDVSPVCDGYGKEYRMWTARPTEEQRVAVPWEKSNKELVKGE